METLQHMIYHCRVSKEIWDYLLTEFKVFPTIDGDRLSITNRMLSHASVDKSELLNLFLGWKIWKMRNNIIFQQEREHIIHIVHKAIRGHQLWQQAVEQEEQQRQLVRTTSPRKITLAEVIPQTAQYYCLMDASWKNQTEPSGTGWYLYSIRGIQILQGSSSAEPTDSVFKAESLAMRIATHQLRALKFTNVALFTACKKVIDLIKRGRVWKPSAMSVSRKYIL